MFEASTLCEEKQTLDKNSKYIYQKRNILGLLEADKRTQACIYQLSQLYVSLRLNIDEISLNNSVID